MMNIEVVEMFKQVKAYLLTYTNGNGKTLALTLYSKAELDN